MFDALKRRSLSLLPALLLLLLLLLLHGNGCQGAATPFVDVLEGESAEFVCNYNPSIDAAGMRELALFLQNCSAPAPSAIPVDASEVAAVAIVMGRMTGALFPSYRQRFQSGDAPVLNERHPLVSNGAVSLWAESSDVGRITVGVGSQADGRCVVCAQTVGSAGYSETKRARVRLLTNPAVRLSVNGAGMSPNSLHQISQGESLLVACGATGYGGITARLLRDGQVLQVAPDEARHETARAEIADSGQYRCEGTSDVELLRQKSRHFAATNFTLAVKFAPIFEVSEIVRYTEVGQREDVQVTVRANPEPKLACSSDQDREGVVMQEGFDPRSFASQFRVTYSNLDEVRKVTTVRCSAENELGSKGLVITLTAAAPRPEITSSSATGWWNSYHLSWQHHVNASVDHYRIRIIYLGPEGQAVNTTEKEFDSKAKLGHVAMVSTSDDANSGRRTHNGVVFNLTPNSPHDISLQSCNRHGCSEFSDAVRVHTAAKSGDTFNDPYNPQYRVESDPRKLAPTTQTGFGSLVVAAACGNLAFKFLIHGN